MAINFSDCRNAWSSEQNLWGCLGNAIFLLFLESPLYIKGVHIVSKTHHYHHPQSDSRQDASLPAYKQKLNRPKRATQNIISTYCVSTEKLLNPHQFQTKNRSGCLSRDTNLVKEPKQSICQESLESRIYCSFHLKMGHRISFVYFVFIILIL